MRGLARWVLIGIALIPVVAHAEGFVWRTDDITATVKRDPVTPLLGQFLLLEQQLEPGETGWKMLKIDLPERWPVNAVAVASGKVTLTTLDGSRYELTRENVSAMHFEILDGGPKSEERLDEIWRKHARVGD